jgi:drug/metabolite transporter (DMT)-like permease
MGIVYALISMVFAGISAYLYKFSSPTIGPTNATFFYYLSGSLIAALVWVRAHERVPIRRKDFIWLFFTALMPYAHAVRQHLGRLISPCNRSTSRQHRLHVACRLS